MRISNEIETGQIVLDSTEMTYIYAAYHR